MNQYQKAKARALANPLAHDDPRHGTVNGYSNRRCRCDRCKAAWVAYCLSRREARRNKGLSTDDLRHGLENTYFNHACRCHACTEAHRLAAAARRARLREVAA